MICFGYIIISGSCRPKKYVEVKTDFLGTNQVIKVGDSVAAKMLVGNYPVELKKFDKQHLNNETIRQISEKYSLDVATIYALNRLYQDENNHTKQKEYLKGLETLMSKGDLEMVEPLRSK